MSTHHLSDAARRSKPLNRQEILALYFLLSRLRAQHHDQFERWYDQANMTDVHDYTFIGWIIDRKLREDAGP